MSRGSLLRNRSLRALATGLALTVALVSSLALAQEGPGAGEARHGRRMDRSWSPPTQIGPDGRPVPVRPRSPGPRVPPHRGEPAKAESHAGGHGEECPGHGPEDPPPAINFWHGLLMANNVQAQKPGFLNRLLFRYENPANPCDPKNEPPPLLATIINFGVLAFIIYRFGRKPLSEALLKRKQTIMADIDSATKLRDDAEARLADYREKIDHIAETMAELRAEYAAQAEAEKRRILAEAEERRVRMRADASFRIEQELKTAKNELIAEAVEASVAAAEELIAKQASARDLDRIAADYLKNIGSSVSASDTLSVGGAS